MRNSYRNASRELIHREVYNTRYWINLRRDYLRNHKYKCEQCNKRRKSKGLILHHKIPLNQGGNPFSLDNLKLLCRKCHHRIHGDQFWKTKKRKLTQRDQFLQELKQLNKNQFSRDIPRTKRLNF